MSLGMLGKYERLDVLGHGASGIVYLAQDTLLKKQVALKEITASGEERQRVLEEARVLDRLRHPNIVAVNGVDIINGKVVIDMEYVAGGNLQDLLSETNGPLPLERCVTIAVQVCDGLAYAHRQHTVHRDVKPANILLADGTAIKLADFGIAQVLGTHSFAPGAGTFAYMAPEDFDQGKSSDRQSDIWAVGVILFEMLTGQRPFSVSQIRDPFAWSRAIQNDDILPPSTLQKCIPPEIDRICLRALCRARELRYLDAAEMASDLRAALQRNITVQSLIEWADIDELLKAAPICWAKFGDLLTSGSLRYWLGQIGEPLLAEVAGTLENGTEVTLDGRLREFLYRAGLDLDYAAREYARTGASLLDDYRYIEAVEQLQAAINLDPSSASYFRLLASAARGAGDPELAREALLNGQLAHPKDRPLRQDVAALGESKDLKESEDVVTLPISERLTFERVKVWYLVLLGFCLLPAIVGSITVLMRHSPLSVPIGLISAGCCFTSFLAINVVANTGLFEKLGAAVGVVLLAFGINQLFVVVSHTPSYLLNWPVIVTLVISFAVPITQATTYAKSRDVFRKWPIWYGAVVLASVIVTALICGVLL